MDESKISSFVINYAMDFGTVFLHFTIYSTSCTYHMATAVYVSAMVLDVKQIMEHCNVIISTYDSRPFDQYINLKNTLHIAISLHANILK